MTGLLKNNKIEWTTNVTVLSIYLFAWYNFGGSENGIELKCKSSNSEISSMQVTFVHAYFIQE